MSVLVPLTPGVDPQVDEGGAPFNLIETCDEALLCGGAVVLPAELARQGTPWGSDDDVAYVCRVNVRERQGSCFLCPHVDLVVAAYVLPILWTIKQWYGGAKHHHTKSAPIVIYGGISSAIRRIPLSLCDGSQDTVNSHRPTTLPSGSRSWVSMAGGWSSAL